jgi:cholest-4-en-3-one 26-monooxygenase
MTMPISQSDVSVLDPDTYANGDPETFGMPLAQYRYLREELPCYLQKFNDPFLLDECWVLSRHADVDRIDRDTETFAVDRGYFNTWRMSNVDWVQYENGKPALLTVGGEDHRRQRGILRKGFGPATLPRLEDRFRTYAREVVDKALDIDGPFNFVTGIAHEMPMRALGDMLGVPEADRPKFFHWVDTFGAPFDPRVTKSLEEVETAITDLMDYALALTDLRRVEPADDVMTRIAEAAINDQLSRDEIMGNVSLLANGAAESTRTALGHGVHELMRDSDQMAWLRERADDIPASAVHEIVRVSTPFTHLVRTVTRDDVEFHGQHIPEGDRVCMLLASANFDPAEFDEPERFDLSRTPNFHMSFGAGPHACLGKHVAVLEIKILLEELLQRTKDIRPAGPISYTRDNFARGVYSLPVTIEAA